MYKLAKVFLFSLQPEKAHYLTMKLLKWGLLIPGLNIIIKKSTSELSPKLNRKVMGLDFINPIGLAAGFDKDGKFFSDLQYLGFGFIEIGTVTPKAQCGNPKPRLFRIKEDEALINRMGFNNEGVEALVERLKIANKTNVIIGGNIGKNKITSNENAIDDYIFCLKALHDYVDYFVVNVSSPNTPNLRSLQDKEPLTHLLKELKIVNATYSNSKPILLKIAPDINEDQLTDIIEVVRSTNIEGVIATNTTISRANLNTSRDEIKSIGNGGLSGKPLTNRSTEVIKSLRAQLGPEYVIIGVGGIHSEQDALDKLDAGADLIQLYTGFIYEGPNLIKRINKAILVHK